MKRLTIIRGGLICLSIVLLISSAAYGEEVLDSSISVYKSQNIKVTYPEKNTVISGYFLPVSWSDPAVENTKIPYPENYKADNREYRVSIFEKANKTLIEKNVSGQNFCVLNYDEIKDTLERGKYFVKVEDVTSATATSATRFFYEKPLGEISDSTISNAESDVSDMTDTATGSDVMTEAATSSACSYCLTDGWPGLLVIVFDVTTYDKILSIDCNQTNWYTHTYASDYTGPEFISISSGNFEVSYYDFTQYLVQCPVVTPFKFTLVEF
jgi:hypothetical protein